MLAALLSLLGIPTRAEVQAAQDAAAVARVESDAACREVRSIHGRLDALEASILGRPAIRALAIDEVGKPLERSVGALRARIEALEEQQPQRRPREHA